MQKFGDEVLKRTDSETISWIKLCSSASYKLLFIVYRCQNVDLLQHELRHLVSLNNHTLPTALRRPLTNNTQNVQGIAISRSASECTACASLLEQHKTWLFSATLAVYITIPLRSTSLRSAICMAGGVHITGGPQITSDVSPLGGPYR